MQVWASLQIMFGLALAACGFALIIAKLHVKDKLEEQEVWKRIRAKLERP